MTTILSDELEEMERSSIEEIELANLLEDPVPIYNDNNRMDKGKVAYSSSFSLAQGLKDYLGRLLRDHVDNSIQHIVLSMDKDKQTVFQQLQAATMKIDGSFDGNAENTRAILPGVGLVLDKYSYTYSSPYNNYLRYQFSAINKAKQLVSFLNIPMQYDFKLYYYCRKMDQLLRFTDNIAQNAQLAQKKEGFAYKVLSPKKDQFSYVRGNMLISSDASTMSFERPKLTSEGLETTWCAEINIKVWGSVISRPYLVPAVMSPVIQINMNGEKFNEIVI